MIVSRKSFDASGDNEAPCGEFAPRFMAAAAADSALSEV